MEIGFVLRGVETIRGELTRLYAAGMVDRDIDPKSPLLSLCIRLWSGLNRVPLVLGNFLHSPPAHSSH